MVLIVFYNVQHRLTFCERFIDHFLTFYPPILRHNRWMWGGDNWLVSSSPYSNGKNLANTSFFLLLFFPESRPSLLFFYFFYLLCFALPVSPMFPLLIRPFFFFFSIRFDLAVIRGSGEWSTGTIDRPTRTLEENRTLKKRMWLFFHVLLLFFSGTWS